MRRIRIDPRISYVYVIFDLNGVPCYVGKGKQWRWRVHFWQCGSSNKALAKLIKDAGGKLPITLVREHLTEKQALATEYALIHAIGSGERGPLLNIVDKLAERSGHSGHIHSAETRAIIKAKRAAQVILFTEERCKNISEALKGKKRGPQSAEYLAKRVAGMKAAYSSGKRIHRGGMQGKTHSEETRIKMSKAAQGRVISPSQRSQISQFHTGRKASEETKAKMSAAQAQRYAKQKGIIIEQQKEANHAARNPGSDQKGLARL